MQRTAHYDARQQMPQADGLHPAERPSFPLRNRMARALWNVVWLLLYRPSPRPLHGWRTLLLRLFGARMGRGCHFYPGSRIWAPWNLTCEDFVAAADGAEIYNPAPMHFGRRAILSQNCFICGATHDYNDPAFPLMAFQMTIGPLAWVCARASLAPGVQMGEGAVLGLGAVATRSLEPWGVYAGNPAERIRTRTAFTDPA